MHTVGIDKTMFRPPKVTYTNSLQKTKKMGFFVLYVKPWVLNGSKVVSRKLRKWMWSRWLVYSIGEDEAFIESVKTINGKVGDILFVCRIVLRMTNNGFIYNLSRELAFVKFIILKLAKFTECN